MFQFVGMVNSCGGLQHTHSSNEGRGGRLRGRGDTYDIKFRDLGFEERKSAGVNKEGRRRQDIPQIATYWLNDYMWDRIKKTSTN